MEIIIVILGVVAVVWYFLGRIGGVEHQVKFYTKKYSQEINAGCTNEEAICRLVNFYLQGEPEWKVEYMKERLGEYFKTFDQLVYDITLFYYNADPALQVWKIDRVSKPLPSEYVIQQANRYLHIYKERYFGSLGLENPNQQKEQGK